MQEVLLKMGVILVTNGAFLGVEKVGPNKSPSPIRVSLSSGAPLHGITDGHLVPAALSSATPDLWTDPPTALFSAPKYPRFKIALVEKLHKLWQLWQPMIYGRTSSEYPGHLSHIEHHCIVCLKMY